MPDTAADPARRRARRRLLTATAGAVLALVAGTLAAVRLLGSHGPEAGHLSPAARTRSASPGRPALTWRDVAGVRLPFSPTHGPRVIDHGHAAGYSRTRQGAVLAAVQVLARTSATAGPDVYRPVLGEQVIGPNTVAMGEQLDDRYERLRRRPSNEPIRDDAPIPGNNATVSGYLIDSYDQASGTASVEVLLGTPDVRPGQVVSFAVTLRWTDGDWRVVAPPTGDWGTVASLLDTAPTGTLDYGQVG